MPLQIHRLRFDKSHLLRLSEAERNLFVIAGHVCNELATLQKIMVGSMNFRPTSLPAQSAYTVQNWVISKVIAGKLHEASVAMRQYYFSSGLSREYEDRLPQDAREARSAFTRFFGGRNRLTRLRNTAAFHYSCEGIPPIFEAMPNDREFLMYLGEIDGNSLYFYAEELLFAGQFPFGNTEDGRIAFTQLQNEIAAQARNITVFFQGCMAVATERMNLEPEFEPQEVADAETWHMDQFAVPYFVAHDPAPQ